MTTLVLDPERLKATRLSKAWTQDDLARRAGMRHTTVSNLERGTRPARVSTVRRLADALGVDPSEIATVGDPALAG